MSQTSVDPFTLKKVKDLAKKTHFDNHIGHKEMAFEFGQRVALAVKDGIPRDIAIEYCREHFKHIGQIMLDIADTCADEMHKIKTEKL